MEHATVGRPGFLNPPGNLGTGSLQYGKTATRRALPETPPAPGLISSRPDPSLSSGGAAESESDATQRSSKQRTATPRRATQYRVSGLSTWSGRVIEVDGDFFSAELEPDASTPGGPVVADFRIALLDEPDGTLKAGDLIYVTSRLVRSPPGQKNETSSVRLRHLGRWTSEDVEAIRAEGDEMRSQLESLFE